MNFQLPELIIVLVFLLIVALVIGGAVYAAVRLANRCRCSTTWLELKPNKYVM